MLPTIVLFLALTSKHDLTFLSGLSAAPFFDLPRAISATNCFIDAEIFVADECPADFSRHGHRRTPISEMRSPPGSGERPWERFRFIFLDYLFAGKLWRLPKGLRESGTCSKAFTSLDPGFSILSSISSCYSLGSRIRVGFRARNVGAVPHRSAGSPPTVTLRHSLINVVVPDCRLRWFAYESAPAGFVFSQNAGEILFGSFESNMPQHQLVTAGSADVYFPSTPHRIINVVAPIITVADRNQNQGLRDLKWSCRVLS